MENNTEFNKDLNKALDPIILLCNKYHIKNANDLIQSIKIFHDKYDEELGILRYYAKSQLNIMKPI